MRMVKIEQDAMVLAPRDVPSAKHERYEKLINAAQKHGPITVAVVHPCDGASMSGALAASQLRLIKPILVGPVERLRSVAEHARLQIDGIELVRAAHSHNSAAQAVALVAAGSADALMKGSLHTDELMGAVVSSPHSGIRTERRISHCFVMDVPGYPEPLIITDAAINIAPDLDTKVDIVQNAIDLAHAIGVHEVRVAILSALETVTVKVPSTIEAAALCKMAERGQVRRSRTPGARQRNQSSSGDHQEARVPCRWACECARGS